MTRGRKPAAIPQYPAKPTAKGEARLRYRGREIYLGRWNTPESHERYSRVIAEFAQSGVLPAENVERRERFTVAELINAFRKFAETRYLKNGRATSEVYMYQMALGPVVALYGRTPAAKFGPLALLVCRDALARKYCRTKVNEHLGRIRRVWKWGVSRELVPESAWTALTAVEGLRKGAPLARETKPIGCVPQEAIEAIREKVLPPIWAMIQVQLWTGMRPGEVVQMRTCDVIADDPAVSKTLAGKVWAYRPASHKTEHHEKERVIFLGPQAQEVLRPWLQPEKPQAWLFSPAEAMEYHRELRSANRVTPGKSKYERVDRSKRQPRRFYSPHAYAHAIAAGCKKAGVPRWSPNRLRHNAATLIRQRYGVEVARIILGHSSVATTEIYAEVDLEKAARAMVEIG